ncbi:hypothetical protein Terro_1594 [Terriglobus roseus DSM 18391]|uniref:HD domain-containing protein n=1 Tax=Terriglobus roseus (strain DSM 18391 / NRRL B-41598 / KBS 63) TaxID=926566 RepID=I3ZF82_TERRK|nr:HD domain-containing protein [Terriglobus roseus]AFL87900.1 hypothetical protein Terro_1594 [Terriglobus roseus DSM 18391]
MQQVIGFILEIEKLKGVTRKVKPLGLDRYENSAEHSWQLALMAWSLQPYAPQPVAMDRVLRMLLVHDIGEIDTGDTMVFVQGGWAERKQDELQAVRRIFGLLPAELAEEMLAFWQEFEEGTTPEARYANAIDRAMPALLNLNNGGQSWKENGISYERVAGRIRGQIEDGCPALWQYLEPKLAAAKDAGFFGA